MGMLEDQGDDFDPQTITLENTKSLPDASKIDKKHVMGHRDPHLQLFNR